MLTLTINDKQVSVPEGCTIMEAAKTNDIHIPSLCNMEGIHNIGACRICVVEVEGAKTLMASCITKASEGMVVRTNTGRVRSARKVLYELMVSNHNVECLSCKRNQSCEMQELGRVLGVENARFKGAQSNKNIDASISITRDMSKCVLCRRCVTVCHERQGTGIIGPQNRGFKTEIAPPLCQPLGAVNCTFCGQCTVVCPVGALKETSSVDAVWEAIHDPKRCVIVQTAPAVRAAVGELFGIPAGTPCTGKLASALKELRFDHVFDTNWGADLTIMEEGTELLSRLKLFAKGEKVSLPMVTSCSPGWIKYIEHTFPEMLPHLSTCKSPHMMTGAIIKTYYAQRLGIAPEDMFVVSVMPCTAKKFEITRAEMMNYGLRNVDAVLTTRELGEMINSAGIDFANMPDSKFHDPFGFSTGAADIFGFSGGVMEAALRTAYEVITGRELPGDNLHVTPIIGLEDVKDASILIESPLPEYAGLDGVELKVAVTSGTKNAKTLMKQVKEGNSPYHFIEVMGCAGGCIVGGGQPRSTDGEIREKRRGALLWEDEHKKLRKSHENPAVMAIYGEFLGEPNGPLSHKLLHTSYVKRGKYNEFTDETAVIEIPVDSRKVSVDSRERQNTMGARLKASPAIQPSGDSERAMALVSENTRLKNELKDSKETIEILRNIVADYSNPDR